MLRSFPILRLWQAMLALGLGAAVHAAPFVLDLTGASVDSVPAGETRVQVFLFVSTDCPISNSYAPEYRRLAADFSTNRFLFRLIYPNASDTPELIRRHLKEYDLPLTAWRDPAHKLVEAAKVRVTPEAAVYLPGSGWVYHGRIDDRYADFGRARPEAHQRELREVLEKIKKGDKIERRETRAVGCYIADVAK